MKKILAIAIGGFILSLSLYFTFTYYFSYSEGVRSGELIKFSKKGVVFKTWEGEISKGFGGTNVFAFSVLDSDPKVINDLKELEGQYVKLTYEEKYKTFPWWGDTHYFIKEAKKGVNPNFIKN